MKLLISLLIFFATVSVYGSEAATPDLTGDTNNGLRIEIYSELSPLRINQIHSWHVRILDSDGGSVDVEQLQISGGMPEHDHGLPTQPQITTRLDNGDYLLEGVRFHMQGFWQLEIELLRDGDPDTATIDFILQ